MLHSMSLAQLAARSAHVADALRAAGLQPGGLLRCQTLHHPLLCPVPCLSTLC
jgi:hypothetical protein